MSQISPTNLGATGLKLLYSKAWLGILEAGSLAADIDDLTNVVFDLLGSQIFLDG